MIEHLFSHIADGRAIGQMVSLAFMVLLLYQLAIYVRIEKAHAMLLIAPIIITIEGIIFYTYVLVYKPLPNELSTTVSWLLRFQTVSYAYFLMKYLNRKKRISQ